MRSLQYLPEIPVCLSSKVMTVGAERRFWFNGSDCAEVVQETPQVVFRGCEQHMAVDITRGIEIQRPPRLFVSFSALLTAWNQVGSLSKTRYKDSEESFSLVSLATVHFCFVLVVEGLITVRYLHSRSRKVPMVVRDNYRQDDHCFPFVGTFFLHIACWKELTMEYQR